MSGLSPNSVKDPPLPTMFVFSIFRVGTDPNAPLGPRFPWSHALHRIPGPSRSSFFGFRKIRALLQSHLPRDELDGIVRHVFSLSQEVHLDPFLFMNLVGQTFHRPAARLPRPSD